MVFPCTVQKDDNSPPKEDVHGIIPTAKYVKVYKPNGSFYYQCVGNWTIKDLEKNHLFLFGIYADYGRDEEHRNKYPYYWIASSRVLACRRFRQKFTWLKIYKTEQIQDEEIVNKVLRELNYNR